MFEIHRPVRERRSHHGLSPAQLALQFDRLLVELLEAFLLRLLLSLKLLVLLLVTVLLLAH